MKNISKKIMRATENKRNIPFGTIILWFVVFFSLSTVGWYGFRHLPQEEIKSPLRHQGQRGLMLDPKSIVIKNSANSATGETFAGDAFRSSGHLERKFNRLSSIPLSGATRHPSGSTRWSVVTTIHEPSEAVIRAANMVGWCMIIVADTKTPLDYMEKLGLADSPQVHFLSVEQQNRMVESQNTKASEFAREIPFEHFSRKNLGYLYAIQNGAEFIFDFDDDNIVDLVEDMISHTKTPIDLLPNERYLQGAGFVLMTNEVFNPYPLMGATVPNSWPRGFPIPQSVDENFHGSVLYGSKKYSMEQIGVMQFVANENPDIDAVHRMTKPLPMYFKGRNQGGLPLVTPLHAFVPYNAQATIHTPNALWATLLPSTVPGRVSDIWRGYFAEAIFQEYGIQIAFLPPDITQIRNPHDLTADMDAERDLYHKTSALITFLGNWVPESETIPGRMEELWFALYERGYIEEEDVKLVQLWLSALIECGYDFDNIRRRDRQHNVVLMGQYNYDHDTTKLKFWTQKWREVFHTVDVRGPFPEEKVTFLREAGVNVHKGGDDKGYFSPVVNFWECLEMYSKKYPHIEGVIYLHDDAILDMRQLTRGQFKIPTDKIMITGNPINDPALPSFYTLYKNGTALEHDLYTYIFKGMTDAEYQMKENPQTFTHDSIHNLLNALKEKIGWGWQRCVHQQFNVIKDPRSSKYLDTDGGLGCPYFHQSDFMFVPTKLVNEFVEISQLLMEKSVFLECAVPQAAKMLREHAHVEVQTLKLCTTWNGTKRGKSLMITDCMKEQELPSMYHPLKMNLMSERIWDDIFDFVTHRNGRFDNIYQIETF